MLIGKAYRHMNYLWNGIARVEPHTFSFPRIVLYLIYRSGTFRAFAGQFLLSRLCISNNSGRIDSNLLQSMHSTVTFFHFRPVYSSGLRYSLASHITSSCCMQTPVYRARSNCSSIWSNRTQMDVSAFPQASFTSRSVSEWPAETVV